MYPQTTKIFESSELSQFQLTVDEINSLDTQSKTLSDVNLRGLYDLKFVKTAGKFNSGVLALCGLRYAELLTFRVSVAKTREEYDKAVRIYDNVSDGFSEALRTVNGLSYTAMVMSDYVDFRNFQGYTRHTLNSYVLWSPEAYLDNQPTYTEVVNFDFIRPEDRIFEVDNCNYHVYDEFIEKYPFISIGLMGTKLYLILTPELGINKFHKILNDFFYDGETPIDEFIDEVSIVSLEAELETYLLQSVRYGLSREYRVANQNQVKVDLEVDITNDVTLYYQIPIKGRTTMMLNNIKQLRQESQSVIEAELISSGKVPISVIENEVSVNLKDSVYSVDTFIDEETGEVHNFIKTDDEEVVLLNFEVGEDVDSLFNM